MNQLAALLKTYYERSAYRSVADLARAARQHGELSDSYLKNILQGRRLNPAYDKLIAIARALDLGQADTGRLLEAAGIPVTWSEETGLPAPVGVDSEVRRAVAALAPEEGLIDDLLGEILARGEEHPLAALFESLEGVATEGAWEAKRRVAETLPRLVQLQPEAALRLAGRLRQDYHPDYRADIRRRVLEAVPALYRYRPDEAGPLLAYREGDEVYTAMAAVEALHDLVSAGLLPPEQAGGYLASFRQAEPPYGEVIDTLAGLLRAADERPDEALGRMNAGRAHPDRLVRIAILRTLPRLLARRPEPALDLILYFLRLDEEGRPAEHQNLRRPVSKALPEILSLPLAVGLKTKISAVLDRLAADPDIHVRRALSDALDPLALLSAEMTVAVLDRLIGDADPYVRRRAWRTLLRLADLYPEQGAAYYARLLTAPPSEGQGAGGGEING